MRKLYFLLFLVIAHQANAQGLFGFGTQKLSKKKIQKLEMVLKDADHLSPSSLIKIDMIAFDPKGKEYKTRGLAGGDYWMSYNYKVEVENGTYDENFQTIRLNKVNELRGDEIKIKVTLNETPVVIEKALKIDFLGTSIANYAGMAGRSAPSGQTVYGRFDGSAGQHGGSNSEAGAPGSNITAAAKMVNVKGEDFLRVYVINNDTKEESYYMVKKSGAGIVLDVSGGRGGNGGHGASGTAGDKAKYVNGGKGGDGGNGANGGNAGSITIKLDNNIKGNENLIKYVFDGGAAGFGGIAGTGGTGYTQGTGGKAGIPGLPGLKGNSPKIIYENVELKWYE